MIILLFLPDFRSFVRNKAFNPEGNEHPVFYFEEDAVIHFYKPIGNVIYKVEVSKEGLPENLTIDGLKAEFSAIQLPSKLDAQREFTGIIK